MYATLDRTPSRREPTLVLQHGAADLDRLAEHPLLAGISRSGLGDLRSDGRATLKRFEPNQIILPRGEAPFDGIYLVLRGTCVVGEEPLGAWAVGGRDKVMPGGVLLRHLAIPAGGLFSDDVMGQPASFRPLVYADGEVLVARVTRDLLESVVRLLPEARGRLQAIARASLVGLVEQVPVPQAPPLRLRRPAGAWPGDADDAAALEVSWNDVVDAEGLQNDDGGVPLPPAPRHPRRRRTPGSSRARSARPGRWRSRLTLYALALAVAVPMTSGGAAFSSGHAPVVVAPVTAPAEPATPEEPGEPEVTAAEPEVRPRTGAMTGGAATGAAEVAALVRPEPAAPAPARSAAPRRERAVRTRSAAPARTATARPARVAPSPEARGRVRQEVSQASDEILVGRMAVAIPRLRRVLDLDPGNPDATLLLGQAHFKRGSYGPAARYLQQASAARPRDLELWVQLGTAHLESDAPEKAEKAFRRALRLSPGHPAARRGLQRAEQASED